MSWGRRRHYFCTNVQACPHARADLIYSEAAYRRNPGCHGINNDGCGAELVEGKTTDTRVVWLSAALAVIAIAGLSALWIVPRLFPPQVRGIAFSSAVTSVSEGTATVNLVVQRTTAVDQLASVQYRTEDGNARAGQDYIAVAGKLNFAPGESRKTVAINLLPGSDGDAARNFSLLLDNAEGAPRHTISVVPAKPSVESLSKAEALIRALSALSADIAGMYVKRKHLNRIRDSGAMDDSIRGSYDATELALQNNMAAALVRYGELQKDLATLDRRTVAQGFEDWAARLDQKDLQQQLDATRIARKHQDAFRKNPIVRPDAWAGELAKAIPAPTAPARRPADNNSV